MPCEPQDGVGGWDPTVRGEQSDSRANRRTAVGLGPHRPR